EDEFSFVLEGRVGALLGSEEVLAEAGDLVFKPRGQWHTFWNAGEQPAVVLEIISPGGFEQAFREMHALPDSLDPEKMATIASRYGCDTDFEATAGVIEKHGLTF
ncbi:MAG: cupin domain-containing protein, partial [Dehalococcoidia bacterium]